MLKIARAERLRAEKKKKQRHRILKVHFQKYFNIEGEQDRMTSLSMKMKNKLFGLKEEVDPCKFPFDFPSSAFAFRIKD
jgi:hypothetical protein